MAGDLVDAGREVVVLRDWRPRLSTRELVGLVRAQLPWVLTLRDVEAIEYVDDGALAFSQLGDLEQLGETMWMVCGIFEPADPTGPWVIAHLAGAPGGPRLLASPVLVAQADVTRVYDGIED